MSDNAIVTENLKPGVSRETWDASTSPNEIEGFATEISINHGATVSFKVNVNTSVGANPGTSPPFHIEIYRLGYYGGDGATLVTTINGLTGAAQPDAVVDKTSGLVDAGNWSVSASWTTPTDAVSGVYLAKIVRDDDGASNQIPFIVRNDGGKSDIVFQTSDTTWQAYNDWGGNNGQVGGNFYGGNVDHPAVTDPGLGSQSRAYAVSYNRPILTRDGGFAAGAQDYLFGAEYAGIYWLEKNGYDVSYMSGVDTDRLGVANLLNHKTYLSVGHDEYWSAGQRANVTAARDAGVNLAFLSGNEDYWRTRYTASTATADGSPTDYRTLICYKETWANKNPNASAADYANIDPSNQWTGTWRDARFVSSTDVNGNQTAIGGGNPENALTGQLFKADGNGQVGPGIDVSASESKLRLWRDTSVAANGGATQIAPGILGYEFDASPNDAFTPAGLIKLSDTTVNWSTVLVDQGNSTPPGTVTHNLSLYKAPSGALVFGAGTVFWTWGLSDKHDSSPYGATIENSVIQQATVNLFADMGIQPQTLQSNLVLETKSTDTIAPHATIGVDGSPASVQAGQLVTISGAAIDDNNTPSTADDGVVAAVQVSTDGGATWNIANGTTSWSYSWVAKGVGQHTLLVRPIDDSANVELNNANLASTALQVDPAPPPTSFSLFASTDGPATGAFQDNAAVELGVEFQSSAAGVVTQLRYFRGANDSGDLGVREGHLWSADGTLLASAVFTSDQGAVGWQTATLVSPVAIAADTTYIVSYHSNDASYVDTQGYFNGPHAGPDGYLTAAADGGSQGGDGVYQYGSGTLFPNQTFGASNYWVDLTFVPGGANNAPPTITSDGAFTVSDDQTAVATITATDADLPAQTLTYAIVPVASGGAADAAKFQIDPVTGALSFKAAPEFEAPTDEGADNLYNVTVAVADGVGGAVQQALAVAVTPTAETPSGSTVLDGLAVNADYIFGSTPGAIVGLPGASQTAFVGAGVEFQNLPDPNADPAVVGNGSDGLASVDVGSTTIRIEFPLDPSVWSQPVVNFASASSFPFNGVRLTFPSGFPSNLLGVSILDQAGFVDQNGQANPLSLSDFTVTSNGLFLNVAGKSRLVDSNPDLTGAQPSFVELQLGFNHAPVITSDGGGPAATVFVADNTNLVTTLAATDPDPGQTVSYSIVPATGGGGEDSGVFQIVAGNKLGFTTGEGFGDAPPQGATPGYQVTVEASDGHGGFAQQTITVASLAETPTVSLLLGSTSVNEGASVAITIASTQADRDGTSTYTLTGIPTDASLGNAAGALTVIGHQAVLTESQLAGLTLTAGETDASLSVTAVSAEGASISASSTPATATLTVIPIAETPMVSLSLGSTSVNEGGAVAVTISSIDPDGDGTSTYTLSGIPSDAVLRNAGGALTVVSHQIMLTESQLAGLNLTAGATDASLSVTAVNTEGTSTSVSSVAATAGLTVIQAGRTYTLTTGPDTIHAGRGPDTIVASASTLGANDVIDGGDGVDTLNLSGVGSFNLATPSMLSSIEIISLAEAQATMGSLAAKKTLLVLGGGFSGVVNVRPASPSVAGMASGVTITGANDSARINLGGGADTVNIGGPSESVIGGGGPATINTSIANVGALLRAGAGSMTVTVTGGGTGALNPGDQGPIVLNLAKSSSAYTLGVNSVGRITINDKNTTADIFTDVAASDTINALAASVTVLATAANAGVKLVGGTGVNVLELTTGGTAILNTGTIKTTVKLDAATNLTLSAAGNSVVGSPGDDTITIKAAYLTPTTSLDGAGGGNTLNLIGGGVVAIGAHITNIAAVTLASSTTFTANDLANLKIAGSTAADMIHAGNGGDTITGGGGADTLFGGAGADTFKDTMANLARATIQTFGLSDSIDLVNLNPSGATATWAASALTVTSGTTKVKINLPGSVGGSFVTSSDGAAGTLVRYVSPSHAQVATLAQAMAGLAANAGPVAHEYRDWAGSLASPIAVGQPRCSIA